ncbi:hypothetical protein LPB144_11730 [Christiangramia salexigens]|uniref:Hybrid sensor histidine kinase/response regulator n=2 Tax=Christiangramia salexigens TaxID=1913577 RepID=A0A1L3J7F6_9FLAO|nr:hypothetical protein LPB144_11730 [Christiangramia salexigens]
MGVSGIVTGQDYRSVQRVEAVEAFLRADDVHLQQDNQENLWITTPVKVLKYNSARLKVYNKFTGVPDEIGKHFLSTYTDSENKIWLAGDLGLAVYNRKYDRFDFVSSTPGRIYTMLEDEANQLWIAAENGIFKLKTDSNEKDYSISRFLSQNTMAAAVTSYNNHIIFAGPNGILTINRKSGKINQLDLGYNRDIEITSAVTLNDGVLFGTRENGLFKTDPQFKRILSINSLPYAISRDEITGLERFNDEVLVGTKNKGVLRLNSRLQLIEESASNYPSRISGIYLNDKNLLWMVSNEGLFIKNFSANTVERLSSQTDSYSGISDNFITASSADANGNIWFGHGDGLSIWKVSSNRWQHIRNLNYQINFKKPDVVRDLLSVGNYMWVATANDGVYKVNINNLSRAHYSTNSNLKTKIQSANTLFSDSRKSVWIGGEDGYLTQIKANSIIKNFPLKGVKALAELGPKQIIVATKSRMHSLNPVSGRIIDLEKLFSSENLPYYSINDLKITQDGRGLIATEGAGMIIYDFEKEEFDILDMEDDLPSNNIVDIKIITNDEFWISTDKGLTYYNAEENTARLFTEVNGLSTNKLTSELVELNEYKWVLGSSKGINIFKPRELLAQMDIKPILQLESLEILSNSDDDNNEFKLTSNKEIPLSEDNGFQIKFNGISHLNPESIKYSWKLEGVDEGWTEASGNNSVNYAGLSPGAYTFKVRAKLGNGGWTESKEVRLNVTEAVGGISTVYPFMGVSVLAMIGIFAFIFIKRSKAADLQAKNLLREKLRKEFRDPVKSAVTSLSKISETADANKGEDLQRYAARFDELFNQILNFSYEESAYQITRIDLKSHIPQLTKDFKPVLDQKKIELIINDQWSSSEFYFDRETLDKIFFSLISASASYSVKRGKIIVNLIETSIGDLKLQFTDNGRGIPLSQLKILEKKNPEIKNIRFRDKNGAQHVLQAKELVLKSGGSFSYESEKNEGATFTVVLKNRKEDFRPVTMPPKEEVLNEEVKMTAFPTEIKEFSESKILIIENDTETRDLLVKNIGKYCQIYQASTAEEGIEKAGMIFPDIIMTATVLPDMNAFQLTKKLKSNIGLNHINIFLVADDDQPIGKDQMEELTEVIRKPVDVNLMLSRLAHILSWQKKLRNSYVQSYINGTEQEYRSESDEKFLANLIDIIVQNVTNENFSVHDLSAKMSLSSNALFMKLKSLVDLSPQDFMEFTRLNYARNLMETGDMNVMEVAYKSGFSSPKLFYSSFKKFFGYLPTDTLEEKPI